jgi:hypothetical protein
MGNCEATAILLTSTIQTYFGDRFMVENIWITGASSGYVGVVILFSNGKVVILSAPRTYYSHCVVGNIAVKAILSELYNWQGIWRSTLGNDVNVYGVFSDYLNKYFSGTEEYIDWMYER